jgi:hypothetical protein
VEFDINTMQLFTEMLHENHFFKFVTCIRLTKQIDLLLSDSQSWSNGLRYISCILIWELYIDF